MVIVHIVGVLLVAFLVESYGQNVGAPTGLTVESKTDTSLTLKWNSVPDAFNYRVYYRPKDSGVSNWDVVNSGNTTTVTIPGLQAYTVYFVQLLANTTAGASNKSKVEEFRTDEALPNPPSDLTAKFVSNTNLSISWTLLTADQANGIIQDYRYIVYDGEVVKANASVSNMTSNVVVTKLNVCRKYVIKVAGRTVVGTGNYTISNLKSTCGPPRITYYESQIVTSLRKFVVLPCNFSGIPEPTVSWILNDNVTLKAMETRKHIIFDGGVVSFVKHITAYSNGSLVIDFVEDIDKGLYTCLVKSSFGNTSAHTNLIVGGGAVTLKFQVFLTNVSKDGLDKTDSNKYRLLSAQIVRAARGALNNTNDHEFEVRDVKIYHIGIHNNKVYAQFTVSLTFNSPQTEDEVIERIVDIMVIRTRTGRLGDLAVSDLVLTDVAPPPPTDLSVVRLGPNYVILQWKRPKNAEVYEIKNYSMKYREFGKSFKTYKMVNNNGPTIHEIIQGLDAGKEYTIRIQSERNDSFDKDKHRGAEKEIKTPNLMLKTILLIIVLPIALAMIAALLICFVFRPMVYRKRVVTNCGLQRRPGQPLQENQYSIAILLQEFPCKWKEIPRTDLLIADKQLGEGAFGKVIKAEYKLPDKRIPCAVKMLKPHATERDRRDLFNELSIMSQVGYHPNVISLLGACTANGPMWVIVKLAENGSLLGYLYEHRVPDYIDHSYMNVPGSSTSNASKEIEPLTKLEKLKFMHGIARGMSHLEKMKCIHRDLAARNVLLDKHMVPMVSDFGLSRDIYVSGMYEDVKGGKRPVRWMPPEAIEDYMCTTKSDVWSFGVTAWEIETAGTVPYAGFDNGMDILNEIKRGYRLEKPTTCDDDVYDIMMSCWRANPLDRPSFKDVTAMLEEMLVGISEYLELQPEDEYQEVFQSPYDEVQINTEDLENFNNAPNGVVSGDGDAEYTAC